MVSNNQIIKDVNCFFYFAGFYHVYYSKRVGCRLNFFRFPYKLGSIVEIAFRYIPSISRDYENIAVSMQCRGLELDAKKTKPIERLKQMILILIPLIVTSFDRVGNISNAMDLRGFGKGKKRSYYSEYPERKNDKIFKLIYCLITIFCAYYIISGIITPRDPKMWLYWR